MYQKGAKGWLKHFDFMLLDLIVLQLSFLAAFQIRHGMVNPYANRDYLALAIIPELAINKKRVILQKCYKND